jgi:hypothetical protein
MHKFTGRLVGDQASALQVIEEYKIYVATSKGINYFKDGVVIFCIFRVPTTAKFLLRNSTQCDIIISTLKSYLVIILE